MIIKKTEDRGFGSHPPRKVLVIMGLSKVCNNCSPPYDNYLLGSLFNFLTGFLLTYFLLVNSIFFMLEFKILPRPIEKFFRQIILLGMRVKA